MENLYIPKSKGQFFVPEVNFNAETGICELLGESYLENTLAFYDELSDWIYLFTSEIKKPITLNVKLTYYNTSSSRRLLELIFILKNYKDNGGEVEINWYYDEDSKQLIFEDVDDMMVESDMFIKLIPLPPSI